MKRIKITETAGKREATYVTPTGLMTTDPKGAHLFGDDEAARFLATVQGMDGKDKNFEIIAETVLPQRAIVCGGPWFKGKGDLPHRVVLAAISDDGSAVRKYVTYMQSSSNGSVSLSSGNYFEAGTTGDAFIRATEDYSARLAKHLTQYSTLVQQGRAVWMTDEEVRADEDK